MAIVGLLFNVVELILFLYLFIDIFKLIKNSKFFNTYYLLNYKTKLELVNNYGNA